MEIRDVLGKVDIFCGLTHSELDLVAPLCEDRRYKANQVIFAEKSSGTDVYIVRKGKVRIEISLRGKDCATVWRASDGQIFGELALVDRGRRSATAICETDCELIAINGDSLDQLFENNSRVGYVIMRNLASVLAGRLRKTNLQLLASILWE